MSSTPVQHSATRKNNLAYVEILPSPLTASLRRRHTLASSHVAGTSSTTLKENTPLRPSFSHMSQGFTPSTSLKRKLLDREPSRLVLDGVIMSAKKPKLTNDAPLKGMMNEVPWNAGQGTSDEFARCHQCAQKRDTKVLIVCTAPVSKNGRPCKRKFCKACLIKRYAEDMNRLSKSTYQCPVCRGICTCSVCRRAKGLEPILKIQDTKSAGDKPKAPKPKAPKEKPQESSKEKEAPSHHTGIAVKAPKPPKPLPDLTWRQVSTNLTQDDADDRIFIREFMFRFGDFMDPIIGKTHLEELEFLAGRPNRQENSGEVAGWVSEMTLKALIIGLLGLLARHHEGDLSKLIKSTIKDIRSAGANLNKLWALLDNLQGEATKDNNNKLKFAAPSPPPAGVNPARSLRSIRVDEGANIVHSSQMIPVVLSLVNAALQTAPIREEIDQGVKDSRDVVKDAREATRLENERWDEVRKTLEAPADAKEKKTPKDKARIAENRAKRALHKDNMTRIENAVKILSSSFSPRFMTLGTDEDGRVYYALSPGVAEREAALEFLEVASSGKKSKLKKKLRLLNDEERKEMREWSWFVAVWGKKPESIASRGKASPKSKQSPADGIDEHNADVLTWWGFWDIQEITKLGDWVSIKSGLEDQDSEAVATPSAASSSSSSPIPAKRNPKIEQLKRLVRGLKDYATLLEWRTKEDRYMVTTA